MALAIISLLAALLPTILGLVVEAVKKRNTPATPKETYEKNREWINEAIAKRAERDVNLIVDGAVRRLREDKIRRDSLGQRD